MTLFPKETLKTCPLMEQVDETDVAPEVYKHCGLYPLTIVIYVGIVMSTYPLAGTASLVVKVRFDVIGDASRL